MDNIRKITVDILESTVKIGEKKFLPNLKITVEFEEDILSTKTKIQENRIVKFVEPKKCECYW